MIQKLIVLGALCCFIATDSAAIKTATHATHHLREVQFQFNPRREVHAKSAVSAVYPEFWRTQLTLGTWRAKPKEDKRQLMDAIAQFRAEICSDMMKKHGKDFSSHDACRDFMRETCKPGKDGVMDGDKTEVTSRKGFCEMYFGADKAVEEIKKDLDQLEKAPAAAPAPAPAPFQGPAPAPGPYVAGHLHMDETIKLPAQGYTGKLVEHDDMKTATEDWGKEFGPKSNLRSYYEICQDHPENPWCRAKGYHQHVIKSGSKPYARAAPFIATLVLWACGLF